MHLADFDTARWEVHIICHECLRQASFNIKPYRYDVEQIVAGAPGWVLWRDERSGRLTLVIASTMNAWLRRDGNHPNVACPEKVAEGSVDIIPGGKWPGLNELFDAIKKALRE